MKLRICLLAGICCLSSLILTAQSQDADFKLIEKVQTHLVKLMTTDQSDELLEFYTTDAISMPNYGAMLLGRDAIAESHKNMTLAGFKVTAFNVDIVEVSREGSTITEIGNYQIELKSAHSPELITDEGSYLNRWEVQEKGMPKIKTEIWNTTRNPMEETKEPEKKFNSIKK